MYLNCSADDRRLIDCVAVLEGHRFGDVWRNHLQLVVVAALCDVELGSQAHNHSSHSLVRHACMQKLLWRHAWMQIAVTSRLHAKTILWSHACMQNHCDVMPACKIAVTSCLHAKTSVRSRLHAKSLWRHACIFIARTSRLHADSYDIMTSRRLANCYDVIIFCGSKHVMALQFCKPHDNEVFECMLLRNSWPQNGSVAMFFPGNSEVAVCVYCSTQCCNVSNAMCSSKTMASTSKR